MEAHGRQFTTCFVIKPTQPACRVVLLRKELRHRFQSFRMETDENESLPEAYDSALREHIDEDLRDII
jgi:hypothetical protein